MNLSCLLSLLKEVPVYRQLVEGLLTTNHEHKVIVLDAAEPYLVAALYEELDLPLMVITAQPEGAKKLQEQLQVWCPPSTNLHGFPELDFSPYEYFASYPSNTMVERLQALATLVFSEPLASPVIASEAKQSHYPQDRPRGVAKFTPRGRLHEESGDSSPHGVYPDRDSSVAEFTLSEAEVLPQNDKKVKGSGVGVKRPPLIVASALAVISKTIPREDFATSCHVLQQGMTAEPVELLHRWQNMGYEMEDVVEVPGQLSRRGGIVDIFPVCSQSPARIEFWGNQIESMRLFNTENQCSTKPISSLTITPAKEILRGVYPERDSSVAEPVLSGEILRFAQNDSSATESILDYLDDTALIILDAPEEIQAVIERLNKETQELRRVKWQNGELPQGFPSPYLSWEELQLKVRAKQHLILEPWDATLASATGNYIQALPFTSPPSYGGNLERFLMAAKQMIREKQRLIIVSHQANRLAELLRERDVHTSPTSKIEQVPPRSSITLLQGSLAKGWVMDKKLNLITDAELFGFVKQRRLSRKTPIRASWLLPQLSPGDYVVHVDHGIGKFSGLIKISTEGTEREYLVLQYAAGDKLYVPTDQIGRVSRYIGTSDQPPTLSRLGTQEWQRTKRRVEQSVADIAQGLLALYAAREITPGFAFSPDTLWQQELEASFPYLETPDQAEAVVATKEDMEKTKPMDRLICGDVGYGKTEVALRAAFKTVMDNKQVAILVPTTVLAQQHFTTFSQRLQAFPLRIEMLSRFCSSEKEREILVGLANGTVDICIGTHRLLQKDVAFKDIGLVIIDEEQRFGVVQKEKLKQMRKEVDVLTLSATPIPRTLHMSLTGIRDMSLMETPPEERLSIKTYLGTYDDTLVRQAILRELERNGQVFFVHNRVQSIALVASKLQSLVPEAKITIAHGQMPEEKLERVMADFIAGNYDILVTTTIIQLGLDMPNVNTLIVDQADKFGLTQLYQLRGRIGRGTNQAHAYFLFDKGKQLTPQAYKRLRTIFEATELGAGFGIAMKDLEIRGAGNLLGVKQSGHIAAIGFDLYCQLLTEAVDELKAKQAGEVKPKEAKLPSPSIALPLTAYIPEEYVPNLSTRLSLYHRLAKIEHAEEIEDMTQELRDRFGVLPQPVENLLYIIEIKILAAKVGVESIYTRGKQVVLNLADRKTLTNLPSWQEYKDAVKVSTRQIRLDTNRLGDKWPEVLGEVTQEIGAQTSKC
ncbi:MAG: transcription-repair coupling factor [Dehalococcoidia bacterium]|nr:transcription-repair coupling factor [Dehalococcoidia bacterium]